MESEVQKQGYHMPIYWEQNVGGAQVEDSNMEEDDETMKYKNHRWKLLKIRNR